MDIEANRIIDVLGGTGATARLCKTSPGAVSQWRRDGIPEVRLMYLKLARPDAFKQLEVSVIGPEEKQAETPARALACATQSVRLTAGRRDANRRELARRAEPVAAPQPDQLRLALDAGADQEAA